MSDELGLTPAAEPAAPADAGGYSEPTLDVEYEADGWEEYEADGWADEFSDPDAGGQFYDPMQALCGAAALGHEADQGPVADAVEQAGMQVFAEQLGGLAGDVGEVDPQAVLHFAAERFQAMREELAGQASDVDIAAAAVTLGALDAAATERSDGLLREAFAMERDRLGGDFDEDAAQAHANELYGELVSAGFDDAESALLAVRHAAENVSGRQESTSLKGPNDATRYYQRRAGLLKQAADFQADPHRGTPFSQTPPPPGTSDVVQRFADRAQRIQAQGGR
jgi:hypothetical protein